MLSAAAQLIVASEGRDAHFLALPSHIHAGRFSCETEKSPQECASELQKTKKEFRQSRRIYSIEVSFFQVSSTVKGKVKEKI